MKGADVLSVRSIEHVIITTDIPNKYGPYLIAPVPRETEREKNVFF